MLFPFSRHDTVATTSPFLKAWQFSLEMSLIAVFRKIALQIIAMLRFGWVGQENLTVQALSDSA